MKNPKQICQGLAYNMNVKTLNISAHKKMHTYKTIILHTYIKIMHVYEKIMHVYEKYAYM